MKKILIIAIPFFALAACNTGKTNDDTHTIDSLRMEVMKQHIADSVMQAQAAVAQPAAPVHEYRTVNTTHNTTNTTTTAAAPAKKKGWSAKAKGALIGAGVGAVTGAVVDKRHGEGAVIGGLTGAAAGTGVGAIIDDKKKK